jgi:hypothetical protein
MSQPGWTYGRDAARRPPKGAAAICCPRLIVDTPAQLHYTRAEDP